jgi:hypothetical protein
MHDRGVDRISRLKGGCGDKSARVLNVGELDRQDSVDETKQGLERRLDGIAAADGDVSVQDLLNTSASVTSRSSSTTSRSSSRLDASLFG